MAKRARGAGHRPGQRRAMQRSGTRPAQPSSRSETPQAGGAEALATSGPAAEVPAPTARARNRVSSASFEESAAHEYAYVASDVRRIALIGGSLFAVLIALWLLIEVLGVIHL